MCDCTSLLLYFLALLFPPFPVWVKRGLCSADSLINLALCCLGVIPGLLHSWYIIATTPEQWQEEIYYTRAPQGDVESARGVRREERVGNDGSVRYIYVTQGGAGQQQRLQEQAADSRMNYGAVEGSSTAGAQGQSSDAPPPAYHEAIQGDNKVQRP